MSAATAISTGLLAIVPDPTEELKLLLLPLLGALLVSGGTIMLYPERETRSIVIGRSTIALFFATIMPQIVAITFTSLSVFLAHPTVLLGSGAMCFMVFYVITRPFFDGLYKRRRILAEAVIQSGQERLLGTVKEAVSDAVNGPAAKEVLETAQRAAEDLKQVAEDVKAAAAKTDRLPRR